MFVFECPVIPPTLPLTLLNLLPNPPQVGNRFSGQLKDLIAELDATGLHFVRCVR